MIRAIREKIMSKILFRMTGYFKKNKPAKKKKGKRMMELIIAKII